MAPFTMTALWLVGGFIQLLMQELISEWASTTFVNTTTTTTFSTSTTSTRNTSSLEYNQYLMANNETDNVTIRTGIFSIDLVFGGSSILMSIPSRNFQMVDCLWENTTSSTKLIHLGTNVGAVLTALNESLITLLGSFSFHGLELPLLFLQEASSLSPTNGRMGPGPGPCASGMSRSLLNFVTHECLEEGDYGSWRNTSTCPL
jgi:hypothetical protein